MGCGGYSRGLWYLVSAVFDNGLMGMTLRPVAKNRLHFDLGFSFSPIAFRNLRIRVNEL